jgi:hypothetical protein
MVIPIGVSESIKKAYLSAYQEEQLALEAVGLERCGGYWSESGTISASRGWVGGRGSVALQRINCQWCGQDEKPLTWNENAGWRECPRCGGYE